VHHITSQFSDDDTADFMVTHAAFYHLDDLVLAPDNASTRDTTLTWDSTTIDPPFNCTQRKTGSPGKTLSDHLGKLLSVSKHHATPVTIGDQAYAIPKLC
jgi:hypothetical protein